MKNQLEQVYAGTIHSKWKKILALRININEQQSCMSCSHLFVTNNTSNDCVDSDNYHSEEEYFRRQLCLWYQMNEMFDPDGGTSDISLGAAIWWPPKLNAKSVAFVLRSSSTF